MNRIIVMIIGLLIISLVGCNSSEKIDDGGLETPDNNNNVVIIKEDDSLSAVLSGRVTDVSENSIAIITEDQAPYVVHFYEDLQFAEDVSRIFKIGHQVAIGFSGEVMESYPMQINAQKIIANDPAEVKTMRGKIKSIKEGVVMIEDFEGNAYQVIHDQMIFKSKVSKDLKVGNLIAIEISKKILEEELKIFESVTVTSNEEDQVITLDPREAVSGYINDFPMIIIDEVTAQHVTLDTVFAIALEENPSTGYHWEVLIEDLTFEMTGDGLAPTSQDIVGAPSVHYYGFKATSVGEHRITFMMVAPDQTISETKMFDIVVNE